MTNALLRTALTTMLLDPASPLTPAQRQGLQTRLQQRDVPLTAEEAQAWVPVLRAWSAGKAWEQVLMEGLRRAGLSVVVDETLILQRKE